VENIVPESRSEFPLKAWFPLSERTARLDWWPVGHPVYSSRVNVPIWRVMQTDHPSTLTVNSGCGNRA